MSPSGLMAWMKAATKDGCPNCDSLHFSCGENDEGWWEVVCTGCNTVVAERDSATFVRT